LPTCPSGHSSTASDYCDVCGLPITDTGGAPPPTPAGDAPSAPETPPAAPAPSATTCPNCGAVNPENALFCEACGYDFTTGQSPRTPSPLDLGTPVDTPADPSAQLDPPTAASQKPVAPALAEAWVAEVWIDPDWYADQDSSDPLPSAGVPVVVPLRTTSILVGRASRSRNIHPDIDLSTDSGISRRHCQLTTDGTRWWVEDLGSSNGTYVGGPLGPLPTDPIPAGEKREIAPDERIYLGAWSRIVLRKASPGEL
jgi:hypothetical protein